MQISGLIAILVLLPDPARCGVGWQRSREELRQQPVHQGRPAGISPAAQVFAASAAHCQSFADDKNREIPNCANRIQNYRKRRRKHSNKL
jgi:hypothetical protein